LPGEAIGVAPSIMLAEVLVKTETRQFCGPKQVVDMS